MSAPLGNKNAYGKKTGRADITELGLKTRFGAIGGPAPRAAQRSGAAAHRKNGTIRKHLATLTACGIACEDIARLKLTDFANIFGFATTEELTFGHLAAITFYKQAISNGKVMAALIDNVDGRLVQKSEGTVPQGMTVQLVSFTSGKVLQTIATPALPPPEADDADDADDDHQGP